MLALCRMNKVVRKNLRVRLGDVVSVLQVRTAVVTHATLTCTHTMHMHDVFKLT